MAPLAPFDDAELDALEAAHPRGLLVQEIVEAFTRKGEHLTEATFRKYVQLGLLPRSRRVGRGKGRGSQGMYPVEAVRQLAHLRHLMGLGYSIEEIQKSLLFVRGDIDALERQLQRIYDAFEQVSRERKLDRSTADDANDHGLDGMLEESKKVGEDLVRLFEKMERSIAMRARMSRATL